MRGVDERDERGTQVEEGAYLGASATGDDADVDFGLAKDRGGRCEDDVAHKRELAAAAELWYRTTDVRGSAGKLNGLYAPRSR